MDLNLQNKQLRDFTDVWPYVKAPRDITTLNLKGNKLQDLPKNLSRFTYLKKVDLSRNPIKQIDLVIDGLVSLPKLRELSIDNITETGFLIIKNKLPKLEQLNGINIKELSKQDKTQSSNKEQEYEAEVPKDLNYIRLAFDCLDTLYKEKNERYSALKSMDDGTREKLVNIGNELNANFSAELLGGYNLKIENDVNFYVLGSLATFIRTYGDDRIATLIDFIAERSRVISDAFFDIVKEKERVVGKNKSLKRETQHLRNKLEAVTMELEQERNSLRELAEPTTKYDQTNATEPKQYRIVRPMNKGNLKDLIREVIESKKKSDKNSIEAGVPLKSFKEYLHYTLNKKFGLPQLVDETIESIIMGVEEHQGSDVDVFIFKKMIENNLNEQFYTTIHKIKKTLRRLLFSFIKAKYKTTATVKFETVYDSTIKGKMSLKEAQLLLFLLYPESDSVELSELVADDATPVPSDIPSVRMLMTNTKREYEIKWSTFENTVLKYIATKQTAYVQNFCTIFKEVDEDNRGLLSEAGFRMLIGRVVDIIQVDINTEELLVKLDPGNTKVVAFSQCLSLLASLYTQNAETQEEVCILTLLNHKINNLI